MSAPVLVAVLTITALTIGLGVRGVRVARTPGDFLVASRAVGPLWNASAISGEYLSAASFLGVAGLVMRYGLDMLWYPVGFAAGYLMLLLFVAAPLRRFGSYTIPDFAEGRLQSVRVRRIATGFVLVIGWFYLVPQLRGAGVTVRALFGVPYWVGVVAVAAVVVANVAGGGMRAITLVQAFQYWVKITAITLPAAFALVVFAGDGAPPVAEPGPARLREPASVAVPADVAVTVVEDFTARATGAVDGRSVDGPVTLAAGRHDLAAGTVLWLPEGAAVPYAAGVPPVDGLTWARPLGPGVSLHGHPVFSLYSLILATFLGTMGLPHIVVRFFTNTDGAAARRTTVLVLCLIGAFYLFPAVYGGLGRLYAPDLYLTGATDTVVLELPRRLVGGIGGELLTALVAAGAFAAFLSTASGLLVSLAGALGYDVWRGGVRAFRWGSVLAGAVAAALALGVRTVDIGVLVGWAFAIAASAFCPLLILGVWWRRLTATGAAAGMLVGGGMATLAILAGLAGLARTGWPAALTSQPAAWSVPVAFAVMVAVSRATRAPDGVTAAMLGMHLPEGLVPAATARGA